MNKKEVVLPFGKTIYQSKAGHGITTDTAFLVEKVLNYSNENTVKVLELGSGNGIIAIMLAWYRQNWKIKGIEIQKSLVELSNENKNKLNLSNITFEEANLNGFKDNISYDIIVSNPPYFPVNQGKISPVKERAIARHEVFTDMKNILLCINENLSDNGSAFLLYPYQRETDLEKEIKNIDRITIAKKFISNRTKSVVFQIIRG